MLLKKCNIQFKCGPGKQTEVAEVDESAEPVLLVSDAAGDAPRLVAVDQDRDHSSQDHLQQLQAGRHHRHRPRHLHSHGLQGVVGVHHRVDGVVHHHEQPTGRRQSDV